MTTEQLAANPAGDDQLARAREIIADSSQLKERLNNFVGTSPNRGQMNEFMDYLHTAVAEERVMRKIEHICRISGIVNPTGSERLMAMQIGLIQEQNALLKGGLTRALNRMQADAKQTDGDSLMTSLIGGLALGAIFSSQ